MVTAYQTDTALLGEEVVCFLLRARMRGNPGSTRPFHVSSTSRQCGSSCTLALVYRHSQVCPLPALCTIAYIRPLLCTKKALYTSSIMHIRGMTQKYVTQRGITAVVAACAFSSRSVGLTAVITDSDELDTQLHQEEIRVQRGLGTTLRLRRTGSTCEEKELALVAFLCSRSDTSTSIYEL